MTKRTRRALIAMATVGLLATFTLGRVHLATGTRDGRVAAGASTREELDSSSGGAAHRDRRPVPSATNARNRTDPLSSCSSERRKAAGRLLDTLSPEHDPEDAIRAAVLRQYITSIRPGNSSDVQAARKRWPSNVEIAWLAYEGCTVAAGCDRSEALAHLLDVDTDNAAAWMFAMVDARERKDEQAFELALRAAASARFYDSRMGAVYVRLRPLLERLPASEACVSGLRKDLGRDATAQDLADMEAMAADFATTLPFSPLSECRKVAVQSGQWRDCRKVASWIAQGDTLIEQQVGSHLLADLATDDSEKRLWQQRQRELRWLSSPQAGLFAQLPAGYASRMWVVGEVNLLREIAKTRGLWPPPANWRAAGE
jgi:hypothetical protein